MSVPPRKDEYSLYLGVLSGQDKTETFIPLGENVRNPVVTLAIWHQVLRFSASPSHLSTRATSSHECELQMKAADTGETRGADRDEIARAQSAKPPRHSRVQPQVTARHLGNQQKVHNETMEVIFKADLRSVTNDLNAYLPADQRFRATLGSRRRFDVYACEMEAARLCIFADTPAFVYV